MEPGLEACPALKAVDPSQRLDQGLLCTVLGQGRVDGETARYGKHPGCMSPDQELGSGVVPSLERLDQLPFGQGRAIVKSW